MIKDVTNQNTEAIRSAKDSMNFENLESLEQGAGTLYAITVSGILNRLNLLYKDMIYFNIGHLIEVFR